MATTTQTVARQRGKPRTPLTPEQQAKRVADRLAKLIRLASKRIPAAVKRIDHCGNLTAYKPTEAQAVAICDAMQTALNKVRLRLRSERRDTPLFDLPH